jgi:hypothetical protein
MPDSEAACGPTHSHRGPDDDFFCLRFRVWYPSLDCAIRTKFRTSPGCLDCDQGRFNLRRHDEALDGGRGARIARLVTPGEGSDRAVTVDDGRGQAPVSRRD